MPIATKCPGCKALFRLADDLASKKVRCQKCGQLFAVPTPKAAAPPASEPPPPPAAPAAVPPISLSLDEPPTVPAAAVASPTPAHDTIIDAILIEKPKPAEVIEAALVDGPKPGETSEIIDATLAEPIPAAAPPPVPKGKAEPRPPASARRPRRAADLPKHSTFASGALAVLVFALLGALVVACFAGTWVVLNPDKNKNVAVLPPQERRNGFIRNEDKQFIDKGEKIGEFMQQLPLDANGKATVAGNVPAHTVSSYRVFLQQNQRYNLLIVGNDFLPRVRVQDGEQVIAVREGDSRILLSFMSVRTGEHTISVSNPDQFQAGNFTLNLARADNAPPTQINLAVNPNFRTERTLRLEDQVNADFPNNFGPCHKYLLNVRPGEKYQFKITQAPFQPVLRLQNDGILLQQLFSDPFRNIDTTYAVPQPVGVLTIYISSEANALGKYTLQVTRLTEEDKPGPRNVAFVFGDVYHRDETLTAQDPRDGELGHVKTYLIPMEKGMGYNIDMKSQAIDAHLSLFDPQGELVAKDDDSGGDFNARMLFDPKTSGQYRLLASDFKKGTGAFAIDIAKVKLPASTPLNRPLPTVQRQEAGCDVVQADLGKGPGMQHTFSWSADGKAFFLLDRVGMLRRIRYPEFVEDQGVLVGPAQIYLTAEGLLASTTGSHELWVFDPQTLHLKRRLPRVGGTNVLAAPSLPYVYVAAAFNKPDGGQAPGLMRHDLARPDTLAFPFPKLPLTAEFLALTPDGRHLIGRDQDNHMMRWLVQDKKILDEEAGTRYFRNWINQNPPLVIGADGKLLLHPINNRAIPQDDIKPGPPSDYGVAGYRINDFKEPAFILDTGIPYSAAAIDPKSGLICVHTKTKGFVFADAHGKVVRELAISTRTTKLNQTVTRMAFHPDGGKLLAFFGTIAAPKVLSIELPKDLSEKVEEKK